MYFLKSAISGMRRRLVASLLTVFGGAALLTASAAIGLWSLWLTGQQDHLRAARSASVFIDSTETLVVEDVLIKVMQVLKEAGGGRSQPEFFSTHPNPENRVQRINEEIKKTFPNGVPSNLRP